MSKSVQIILKKEISEIFEAFTDLLGIRIVFFTAEGIELDIGNKRQRCDFCRILRKEFGYEEKCIEMDISKMQESSKKISFSATLVMRDFTKQ